MPKRSKGEYGPWFIHETETKYKDNFVEVELDNVTRPDQTRGQHVVVYMKAGVCVLPIDKDGFVYLTNEFHYGIGRFSIEGVSGGIEKGEEPLETAKRELAEELGLAAEQWDYLTTVDPFTTIVVSPTKLYIARGLSSVPLALEGTEQIECVKMSLSVAKEKVVAGEITHSPTCTLLLLASAFEQST